MRTVFIECEYFLTKDKHRALLENMKYEAGDDVRIVLLAPGMRVAEPAPQWIPVSERLPEEIINPNTQDYDWVLCSTTFGDVRAYHFGRGRFLHGCGDVTQYVTAWMPLPEPYREDKR